MSQLRKVAFIGLGQMGLPMARQLVSATFEVVGVDVSGEARAALRHCGGQAIESVAAAMDGAECVVTMLPNGKIVQEALLASDAFKAAPKGALLLEMSSSGPMQTRELSARIGKHMRVVDAPVSGGVKRAIDGTLTIMAGGEDSDIDAAMSVLSAMSSKVFRCGPVGAGHAMKAINNYVSGAGVVAASEGVQLGMAFGLNGDTIVDVLNASSGKNNATEVKMKQFILSGTFASGFALGLMAKDIRTAADLSAGLGLNQTGVRQVAELWGEASKVLGDGVDHTRLYEYLDRLNGDHA